MRKTKICHQIQRRKRMMILMECSRQILTRTRWFSRKMLISSEMSFYVFTIQQMCRVHRGRSGSVCQLLACLPCTANCYCYRTSAENVVFCFSLLGRLFGFAGLKCPSVRPSVRTYVHKKFLRFQWNLACRYRSTSDAWRYAVRPDPRSRSRSRALQSWKSSRFQMLYLLRHLQWQLATDHGFLNYDTICKFNRAGFLIYGLVFVSRDFEVGTNASCEESTVSSHMGLIFSSCILQAVWFQVTISGKMQTLSSRLPCINKFSLCQRLLVVYVWAIWGVWRQCLAAWRSGNGVGRINEVTLRWAWLVLGWVTCPGSTPEGGTLFLYVTSQPGRLSLSSFPGR